MIYKQIYLDEFCDIMSDAAGWSRLGGALLYELLEEFVDDIEMDPVAFRSYYNEITVREAVAELYDSGHALDLLNALTKVGDLASYRFHFDMTKSSEYYNFKNELDAYLDGDVDHSYVMLTDELLDHIGMSLVNFAASCDIELFADFICDLEFTYDDLEDLIERKYDVIWAGDIVFITHAL